MGKVIFVLLLAVFAVQASEVRNLDNLQSPISDLVNVLKKLQKAIDNAIQTVKTESEKIIIKIKDLIKKHNIADEIEKIADDIMNKVADMLAKKGVNVNYIVDCLKAEKPDIQKLVQAGTDAVKGCADAAMTSTVDLRTKAEKLVNDSITTERDVVNTILGCVTKTNLISVALCINKEIKPIDNKVQALVKEAQTVKDEATKVLPPVAKQLEACLKTAADPMKAQAQAAIKNFTQCVAANKPTQAPTAAPSAA